MRSLLAKAANSIKSKTATIKRLHATHEADMVYSGVASLGGMGAAAVTDIKLGKDGNQAKLGPVPTNAIIGLPLVVAGAAIRQLGRGRMPLVAGGMQMIGIAGYRWILDKHAENAANAAANPAP